MIITVKSLMLRLRKCASIASHPSTPSDSGARRFDRCPDIAAEAQAGRADPAAGVSLRDRGACATPLLSLGRFKLMPCLEHVTCSEPTVTPIVSAICSRLIPRSTRFLICSNRAGVNLIGGPLAAISRDSFLDVFPCAACDGARLLSELVRFTSIDFWRFHGLGIEAVDRVSKRRAGTPSLTAKAVCIGPRVQNVG